MLSCGQKLPTDFRLKIIAGGTTREVRFGDLLMRRTIVSIYMRNNTPSCDRQNDELMAHAAEFERLGYNLIALSRDTCGSHSRYAAAKQINYTLASDPHDAFAHAAEAVVEKSMYGRTFRGPVRSAFILDRDGTVLAVVEKVDPKHHGRQLHGAIAAIGS